MFEEVVIKIITKRILSLASARHLVVPVLLQLLNGQSFGLSLLINQVNGLPWPAKDPARSVQCCCVRFVIVYYFSEHIQDNPVRSIAVEMPHSFAGPAVVKSANEKG